MKDDLKERIAKAEESVKAAHKRIDIVEEKKLSKHEFNGFKQVMEGLKDMFSHQFEKMEKSTNENTHAITSLQTTLQNAQSFLPILIRVIKFLGGAILALMLFIATKLMGIW